MLQKNAPKFAILLEFNEKNYAGFRIPKVWQILKLFAGINLLFLKSDFMLNGGWYWHLVVCSEIKTSSLRFILLFSPPKKHSSPKNGKNSAIFSKCAYHSWSKSFSNKGFVIDINIFFKDQIIYIIFMNIIMVYNFNLLKNK